jgi:LPPG:FO 2-phospho-L-lactate transferase
VKVVALAGGIGAGKFLRGLGRVVPPQDVTAIVNTGDDVTMHGLHVSPDIDSVTYWLSDRFDRERGWGRREETFRATEELKLLGAPDAWFNLGDLDLAVHLFRTPLLANGVPLSEVTARICARFGVRVTVVPMTDDPVTTRIDVVDPDGRLLDLHFQEYWVARRAADDVKTVRFEGAAEARPSPGVLDAIAIADVVVICPSNPVVSVAPILAIPGVRDAVRGRRDRVVGVSPIVGGAPIAGMADRLMPAVGLEVTAAGAAKAYGDLLSGWVIDEQDTSLAERIHGELGIRVAVTDTIMADDAAAERVARAAMELASA